jgi:mevalonate kinase
MDMEMVIWIINLALAALAIVAGWLLVKARSKIRQIGELMLTLDKALEDNRITQDELEEIVEKVLKILELNPEGGEE